MRPSRHVFAFTVEEIRCLVPPVYQPVAGANEWAPPHFIGESVRIQDHSDFSMHLHEFPHQGKAYVFTGEEVQPLQGTSVEVLKEDSEHFQSFRTSTLFYNKGRFWVSARDVTTASETEEDSDDPMDQEDQYILWKQILFDWPKLDGNADPVGYSTISAQNGVYESLYALRSDQTWHQKLLPQPYHTSERNLRKVEGHPAPFGSLNGDLSLLIALVAFTADPQGNKVEQALMHCITKGSWREPRGETREGWYNFRGLLVNVFLFNPGGEPQWTPRTLREYEASMIFK